MPTPISHALPAANLRRRVAWLGVSLILLIVAADVYEGLQDRRVALQRSQQTVDLLARSLADQTARMAQELDFALADFAEWRLQDRATGRSVQALRQRLLSHIKRLPYVHSAAIFGPDGAMWSTTEERSTSGVNIAAAAIFRGTADAVSGGLFIGTPWTSRRDGYRTFAMGRRLENADGTFAGVVIVRVAFEYLARVYAEVDVSPGAQIRLLRSDGWDLAHYPANASAADPHGRTAVGAQPAPAWRTHVMASKSVAGYPLSVEVAQPRVAALAAWQRAQVASIVRTGTLAILAGVLLVYLVKAMRRSAEADAARRASEARLQDARKAEALSLLAASVAHDFNNVLSAIVGYGDLARSDSEPGSKQWSRIDGLLAAAERARQLVRRVLTFDNRRSLNYGDVGLTGVVREVLDQIQATLPPQLRVDVDLPAESATVLGDATELHQVVMNLCTNAVQAMPAGGTLTVKLSAVDIAAARTCLIGAVSAGRWYRLSVADQGSGIATGQLADIFEPLHTTKRTGQGTGLGLTVVRNIVASMQGAIDVESTRGAGSRFTVYWRARAAGATESAAPTGVTAQRERCAGRTVLIVDDEPHLVALVEELTASLGYEPVGFSDAARALDAVRRDPQRFDAVISDENMPGLRGVALARAIHEVRPELPVMLLTGYHTAALDGEARACGIREIADKPVRLEDVRRMLERVFRSTPA